MNLVGKCPTCGASVRVVGSEEGTMHYEPTAEAEVERLLAKWVEADRNWIAAKAEVERLRELLRGAVGFIERNPGPYDVTDWLARAREEADRA